MSNSIKNIVDAKLDTVKPEDSVVEKTSKYGMFAITNNAGSGKQLWAYTHAAALVAGLIDSETSVSITNRGAEQFKAIYACFPTAYRYHFNKDKSLIEFKNGNIKVGASLQQRMIKERSNADFMQLVGEYVELIKTGKAGKHTTFAGGNTKPCLKKA